MKSGIVATSQRIASEVEAADNWTDPQLYSQLSADFTALRDALHGIAGSGVNCRADEELEALEFPEAPVEGQERRFVEQLLQCLATLYVRAFELAWECACEALLVPCRACASTADADVLLACLTVDSRGVLDICNLERKHVKTFPALERWLSPFSRALVAPLNVALQRAGQHRELRGPGDLFEFICCQFDVDQWLRALVRWLLPKLQDTPTAVRKPFMSVRGAKRTGKVQLMATRKVFTATAQKIGKKVPDVADRIGSVAAVENLDEVQAAQAVANDTGLQVTGTQRLDAGRALLLPDAEGHGQRTRHQQAGRDRLHAGGRGLPAHAHKDPGAGRARVGRCGQRAERTPTGR